MTHKVGLIVGREWSFPPAFIEEVNKRDQGVVADFVQLGGTRMDEPVEYDVIIDRISHEVPYYRTFLKHAVLQGTTVVNNPFMWSADDKLFGASLANQLGVASPRTVALPTESTCRELTTRRAFATSNIRWTGKRSSATSDCRASSKTHTAADGRTSMFAARSTT